MAVGLKVYPAKKPDAGRIQIQIVSIFIGLQGPRKLLPAEIGRTISRHESFTFYNWHLHAEVWNRRTCKMEAVAVTPLQEFP